MAVAWSSSGGLVICYVLPVLRMTSYLLKAKVARRRRPAEAQCTRSLGLGYKFTYSIAGILPAGALCLEQWAAFLTT